MSSHRLLTYIVVYVMGNRFWILQVIFFTIVPYTILVTMGNRKLLSGIERSWPQAEIAIPETNVNVNEINSSYGMANSTKVNLTIPRKDISNKSKNLINNGIFWSNFAESCVPKGLPTNESFMIIKKLREQNVISLKEGTRAMCGTSRGGIVTLQDGTIVCAKYKRKQRSVYAEVLAFYLSRLLNMDNIPEVFLSSTDASSERWKAVNPSRLDWDEDETIALVTWQEDCRYETVMPSIIREAFNSRETITTQTINNSKMLQNNTLLLAEVIQWGTILIFDDLIGHIDRLVRPLKYGDKNKLEVHTNSLHNSVKSSNGKIWLIDHESAFFYRYKYFETTYNYIRIIPHYDRMLKTLCVFQSKFVEGLKKLSTYSSPYEYFWNFTLLHEPLLNTIPEKLKSKRYETIFNFRLKQILEWIRSCQQITINSK